jgi:hypothetical protein
VWVTLNKTRNMDENLAWDGIESEEDIFSLHQKTLQKMMQV